MSRFIPHWRKATWALVIWAIIGVLWLWAGWSAVGEGGTSDAEAVGGAIGTGIVIFFWFLGFVVLGLIWLMSRPKDNVLIYGPEGQQMQVSEKEARRRVSRDNWRYQPLYPTASDDERRSPPPQ